MKQPWIHNAKTDGIFILSPPFLVLLFVMLFHREIVLLENHYPFYIWLILIVFVDVAHVYSTLFKTYFIKEEFQKRKLLYLGIPVLSLISGLILFQFGSLVFWSVLALVAVFHFVRQQYGFMRLYARFESKGFSKFWDSVTIYAATIFPMLYWFKTPRDFTWFMENEFGWMHYIPDYVPEITFLYYAIIIVWILKTILQYFRTRRFNIPKNLLIMGTLLSWYFGIVYFNNDLIFTLLNVISHGIPYIALIYIREIEQKDRTVLKSFSVFKTGLGILLFIAIIIGLAFFEEFFWEILVWQEHFSIQSVSLSSEWLSVLVPLLVVPQFTHYLLDGFIWRKPKQKS